MIKPHNLIYIDSFVIPLDLTGVSISAATYSNAADTLATGQPNSLTKFGQATYTATSRPYSFIFQPPNLKRPDKIKYIRVVKSGYNESETSSYQGPILIKSDMVDSADGVISTITLGGIGNAVGAFPIAIDNVLSGLLRVSKPIQGSFIFTFFGISSSVPTGRNIVSTDIVLTIECYGEE